MATTNQNRTKLLLGEKDSHKEFRPTKFFIFAGFLVATNLALGALLLAVASLGSHPRTSMAIGVNIIFLIILMFIEFVIGLPPKVVNLILGLSSLATIIAIVVILISPFLPSPLNFGWLSVYTLGFGISVIIMSKYGPGEI